MKSLASTALATLCLISASVQAATLVLSGDRGFGTVEVRDADLYLADQTFGVLVEQTRPGANIGVLVRSSPAGATWSGGVVAGMGVNRTESWDAIYHRLPGPGNGACLIVKDSSSMTVEHLRCDWTWDGFRAESGGTNWKLRLSWLNHDRDDGIENDQCYDGRVEHSLIENAFVGYSARPGTPGTPCPHKLEVIGSVISLGRHFDDLEKRIRPWSNIENGRLMQSGALWKVSKNGTGMRVLLKDSVIKLDHTPGVSASELPIVPAGWEVLPGSGGNTFIWLGQNDLPGLTYEEINGCKVPKEFKVPQELFKVVCGAEGEQLWNEARTKLLAAIDPSPLPPTADPVVEFLENLTGSLDGLSATVKEFLRKRAEPEG